MALHADPGPPGSDSHFLVVIAMAAAAREGIAQPEVLLQRNGIGEIGKARRPLVRRNDEIRVSAVMNSHTLRVHDLAICYIVSDRKQRPNEYLITLLPFGEPGIAVHAGIGQQFGQEAAFGPGWNDDGVLHALRLHQSQYLGTEIVTPVGPAQTTPRHCAGQVNTLDTWGIDPDFPPGQRCG